MNTKAPSLEKDIPISEIVKKVSHLEIRARKLVTSQLQNNYKSVFKGRGIDLYDVRTYFPEDDIRDINWNLTAKMHEPYVKTFVEERELQTLFMIDISGSTIYGSKQSKRSIMSEMMTLLAFIATHSNDKIGLLLFSNDIEKFSPSAKGNGHLLRMIRDALYFEGQSKKTNLKEVLFKTNTLLKKKHIIFLFSDFLDSDYDKQLQILSKRHEVIPIVIQDTLELYSKQNSLWPFPVLANMEDIETGDRFTVDINNYKTTELENFKKYYRRAFLHSKLSFMEIKDKEDHLKALEKFLRLRMGKL